MSKTTTTIDGLISSVCEQVRELDVTEPYVEDRLHEIVDSTVPFYTGDLLDLAAADNELATAAPELGPAFDGSPTPTNIIAANVYERLSNAAHQELHELQSAID